MSLRFDVVTLFPEMFDAIRCCGITGRALQQGLASLHTWNPRDHAKDRHRSVDDRPYGGGPGMVMQVQPLRDAIGAARADAGDTPHVIYLSPQGRRLDHRGLKALRAHRRLILVAGRYEGIDERVIEADIDAEWSIGDYVLSGGELPAMVLIDALIRMEPGALGDEDSVREDSFVDGILDFPHYTRPEVLDGMRVPEVLLGGDHAAIRRWREKQALGRTWLRRPDLLENEELDERRRGLLVEFIREQAEQAG